MRNPLFATFACYGVYYQGLEGNGGVASYVSGKGNGGWGNIGSTLTGGQVSSRPTK